MRAELAIHGEKLGGIWTQINKDKKLCNMIHRLRRLGLTPPQYERKSPQMVNLARNYHNNLQHQGIMAQTEHERTRDIDHTLRAIPPTQLIDDPNRSPMSETATEPHVKRALKFVKNNTTTGMDGCLYELWKALDQHHTENTNLNKPRFDICGTLTKVFQDIQTHRVDERTNFALG